MSGFEVLAWIRQQEGLRGLPVVVLTSSDQLYDVNRAYDLGANSFFVKEFDFNDFVNLAKLLERYWLKTAKTPESSRDVPRRDSL
jgi:CheY-like chemotaxis protein